MKVVALFNPKKIDRISTIITLHKFSLARSTLTIFGGKTQTSGIQIECLFSIKLTLLIAIFFGCSHLAPRCIAETVYAQASSEDKKLIDVVLADIDAVNTYYMNCEIAASSIYTYSLKVGGKTETKQMEERFFGNVASTSKKVFRRLDEYDSKKIAMRHSIDTSDATWKASTGPNKKAWSRYPLNAFPALHFYEAPSRVHGLGAAFWLRDFEFNTVRNVRLESLSIDGIETVRIHFVKNNSLEQRDQSVFFEFSKFGKFAIAKNRIESEGGRVMSVNADYSTGPDGFPILKRVTKDNRDSNDVGTVIESTVTLMKPGAVSLSRFQSADLGLYWQANRRTILATVIPAFICVLLGITYWNLRS